MKPAASTIIRRGSIVTAQQRHDSDGVAELLQKKERSAKDLEMLHSRISMLDGFHLFVEKYFQGSELQEQIKLCSDLVYERKNKGDIIFEQDAKSNNKMYIILSGSCYLFLQKDLDNEEPLNEQQLRSKEKEKESNRINTAVSSTILDKMKKLGSKFRRQFSIDFSEQNLTPIEIDHFKARYGKTTRLLEMGTMFGEIAIIKSQPRTATIMADTHPTELIVLDRDKFLPALDELKRALQLRRDILFQIFKDMDNYSSARMESMLYSFQVHTLPRGQHITEQDQVDDRFYVIAEGEAQVMKRIAIPIGQSANKFEERTVKLSIIGPGVMVGDEVILQPSTSETSYAYTTEITSLKASILVADRKTIERKFPKDLKDYLRMQSLFREKARKMLLENKINELLVETETKRNSQQQQRSVDHSSVLRSSTQSVFHHHQYNHVTQQHQQQLPIQHSQLQQQQFLPAISKYNNDESRLKLRDDSPPNQMLTNKQTESDLNKFDIRKKVFDFGDGLNVENSERIDRIFRIRHKRVGDSKDTNLMRHASEPRLSTLGTTAKNQSIFQKHAKHRDIIITTITQQRQQQQQQKQISSSTLQDEQQSINNTSVATPVKLESASLQSPHKHLTSRKQSNFNSMSAQRIETPEQQYYYQSSPSSSSFRMLPTLPREQLTERKVPKQKQKNHSTHQLTEHNYIPPNEYQNNFTVLSQQRVGRRQQQQQQQQQNNLNVIDPLANGTADPIMSMGLANGETIKQQQFKAAIKVREMNNAAHLLTEHNQKINQSESISQAPGTPQRKTRTLMYKQQCQLHQQQSPSLIQRLTARDTTQNSAIFNRQVTRKSSSGYSQESNSLLPLLNNTSDTTRDQQTNLDSRRKIDSQINNNNNPLTIDKSNYGKSQRASLFYSPPPPQKRQHQQLQSQPRKEQ